MLSETKANNKEYSRIYVDYANVEVIGLVMSRTGQGRS